MSVHAGADDVHVPLRAWGELDHGRCRVRGTARPRGVRPAATLAPACFLGGGCCLLGGYRRRARQWRPRTNNYLTGSVKAGPRLRGCLSREELSEDAFDEAVKLRRLVQVFDHDPFGEGDAGVLELPVPRLVGGGAVAVLGSVHFDHADTAAVGDDEVGPEGALAGAKPGAGQGSSCSRTTC
jgi:hypothetical protein